MAMKERSERSAYLIMTAVFALGVAAPAIAANLHVGPGETYSTIQAAIDDAGNNDVIHIHGSGSPYLLHSASGETANLKIDNLSGVTIQAYSTDLVIIDGNGGVNETKQNGLLIEDGCDDITVKNLTFKNCYWGAIATELDTGNLGHTIDNVIFDDNINYGLILQADHSTVTNCTFKNTDDGNNSQAVGCYLFQADDCTIEDGVQTR